MRREPRIPGLRRILSLRSSPASITRAVDDEVRFHIESRVADLVRTGMDADAAHRRALEEYGEVSESVHELTEVDRLLVRRTRRADRLHAVVDDCRQAARTLMRQPRLSIGIILTLGLAIGANAVMFSIIDRLLLRGPMHVVDPRNVLRAYAHMEFPGLGPVTQSSLGFLSYSTIRNGTSGIDGAAAYTYGQVTTGRGADATELRASYVTSDFFAVAGVQPARGRFFSSEEGAPPAGHNVVVLDYGFWKRRYGGSDSVVGRSLEMRGEQYTIIGVTPRGFTGFELRPVEVWIPLAVYGARIRQDWATTPQSNWLQIVVRLRPDASAASAAASATAVHRSAFEGVQNGVAKARFVLLPISHGASGSQSLEMRVSRWLIGVAVIVLIIACANVTNLLLARSMRRRREIAVRVALGIGRTRLIRLLLIESLLLGLAGGLASLVVVLLAAPIVRTTLLPDVAWERTLTDVRLVAFAAVMTLLCSLAAGLLPAIRAVGQSTSDDLRAGARGGSARSRVRTVLLVAQPALAVVLLVAAGLFVRSLQRVREVDLGIDLNRVLHVRVAWPSLAGLSRDAAEAERARRQLFQQNAIERLRRHPAIESAALASGIPFISTFGVYLRSPDVSAIPMLAGGGPYVSAVTPDYFQTVGTTILRGRGFNESDRGGARVALVNETMATTLWPGANPLGKCLIVFADTVPCARIVGVTTNSHQWRIEEQPSMQYFVPLGQEIGMSTPLLLVRPRISMERAAGIVTSELRGLSTDLPFVSAQPLARSLDSQVRSWELGASVFSGFGLLALVVAAVGLYSVVGYIVEQRTHELGVRMALGATARGTMFRTVGYGVMPAAFGLAIGFVICAALGRFLEPMLFHTSPRDLAVFASVGLALVAVATIAALIPGVRASRIDPAIALRSEA